jgi:hypothetical protein
MRNPTHHTARTGLQRDNLAMFLDFVLSIVLILPTLGYLSSRWTLFYVVHTRELHQHLFGMTVFLLLWMFGLFRLFPKIMRSLLWGGAILLTGLPLVSNDHHYAGMCSIYLREVKAIPRHLDNPVEGTLYQAHKISSRLSVLTLSSIGHPEITSYLEERGYSSSPRVEYARSPEQWESCIALFQEVYGRWCYRPDPFHQELLRPPHRTIRTFSGDCDDYTLLLCTLLMTRGFKMRMVVTSGHIYPEVAIPNDSLFRQVIEPIIKKSAGYREVAPARIHTHRDPQGKLWLNLDYSAPHPGGPYSREEIFRVIYLNGWYNI